MRSREERVDDLLKSAERMAGGDIVHRAEVSTTHDELDALAFAMNVMVGELSYRSAELARAKEEAERRSAELAAAHDSLLIKERLATLGQLAGGVAHQIRNPLAVIMNATSVVKRFLPPERHPDVEHAIRIIVDEIHHANVIITGLLDYARVRKPERRPTSVVDLADRVLRGDWIPPTVHVQRTTAGDPPLLDLDPDQLHDALFNLVQNAVEAMPAGGILGIELFTRGEWMVVAVTDTGPGIASELFPRLFEPLHSTKPMGVGLGLVTARTFVEAHGGHITAVPVRAGARFEIRLPVRRSP